MRSQIIKRNSSLQGSRKGSVDIYREAHAEATTPLKPKHLNFRIGIKTPTQHVVDYSKQTERRLQSLSQLLGPKLENQDMVIETGQRAIQDHALEQQENHFEQKFPSSKPVNYRQVLRPASMLLQFDSSLQQEESQEYPSVTIGNHGSIRASPSRLTLASRSSVLKKNRANLNSGASGAITAFHSGVTPVPADSQKFN